MSVGKWPHRFRVVVRTHGGRAIGYQVVTLRSVEKAIALGVAAHLRKHPEDDVSNRVQDVEVEDLGPVGRDERGVVVLEGRDLVDRMEF